MTAFPFRPFLPFLPFINNRKYLLCMASHGRRWQRPCTLCDSQCACPLEEGWGHAVVGTEVLVGRGLLHQSIRILMCNRTPLAAGFVVDEVCCSLMMSLSSFSDIRCVDEVVWTENRIREIFETLYGKEFNRLFKSIETRLPKKNACFTLWISGNFEDIVSFPDYFWKLWRSPLFSLKSLFSFLRFQRILNLYF